MMMKIAVVDDQEEFLHIMAERLKTYQVDTFTSVYEVEDNYDLMILDIDMPDCDGITYSREHREQRILFLTSYGNRIKEAFGMNVYGFIEKSDSEEVFRQIIKSVIEEIKKQKYISLKIDYQMMDFLMKDIVYLQYIGYKTISFVYHQQTFTISGYSMKEIQKRLGDDFIYIDRSTLVNRDMIRDIIGDRVYLKEISQHFTVSVRKRKSLRKQNVKE